MNAVATEVGAAPRFAVHDYPRLDFTNTGSTRLADLNRFLDELHARDANVSAAIAAELAERLQYLDGYGGAVSEEDPRRRFRVTLGADFAPLSFTLAWFRLDPQTGDYVFAWNGGLIWHGGRNDPLCVSVTPQLWGIHT